MIRICGLAVLMLILISQATAQDNVGLKFFGLSIHPLGEPENAALMPRKLDPEGYLVVNLGEKSSPSRFISFGTHYK